MAQQRPACAGLGGGGVRIGRVHRRILGAALAAAGFTAAAGGVAAPVDDRMPAGADCPRPGAVLAERFVAADCVACWRGTERGSARGWRLDWIVPAGPAAAMAAGALGDAAERQARAKPAGRTPGVLRLDTALAPPQGAGLEVFLGPAWRGYLGVQIDLSGRWPDGSRAWIALVEPVAAGTAGSGVARMLVRSVAGPIPLAADAAPQSRLHAMRWPPGANVASLQARAWVERADGRVLAMASPDCPQ